MKFQVYCKYTTTVCNGDCEHMHQECIFTEDEFANTCRDYISDGCKGYVSSDRKDDEIMVLDDVCSHLRFNEHVVLKTLNSFNYNGCTVDIGEDLILNVDQIEELIVKLIIESDENEKIVLKF